MEEIDLKSIATDTCGVGWHVQLKSFEGKTEGSSKPGEAKDTPLPQHVRVTLRVTTTAQ